MNHDKDGNGTIRESFGIFKKISGSFWDPKPVRTQQRTILWARRDKSVPSLWAGAIRVVTSEGTKREFLFFFILGQGLFDLLPN